ncbi:hypothetical protein GCM10022215_12400 [Nocardioides fonticola]|uniref:GerMN domain-containing protein n=2 Tax=Nocardioides fonticola TaxID=450363 RepID=A0ABP7XF65_9ACTN
MAAALTTALLALPLTACGSDDDPAPASGAAEGSGTPSRGDGASAEPSTAPSSPEPAGTTVPVYYVGDTPQGPRLFREFRRVTGDPLAAAAALVTDGNPLDPDYRTLFPGGTFTSVAVEDGVIVATRDDRDWQTPGDLSEADGALALQQLVYTLQGALQQRLPVEVRVDGEADFLFGTDTAGGVANAAPLDTLGLVNVTSPEEGASVGATLKASGVASSFEATVPWRILDADGNAVLDGFATAEGWIDKLYPWSTGIDVSALAPGDYVFEASTDDPSGGEGGGPTVDTKDFTVS